MGFLKGITTVNFPEYGKEVFYTSKMFSTFEFSPIFGMLKCCKGCILHTEGVFNISTFYIFIIVKMMCILHTEGVFNISTFCISVDVEMMCILHIEDVFNILYFVFLLMLKC